MHNPEITLLSLQQYTRDLCLAFVRECGDFVSLEVAVTELDKHLCKQLGLLCMNLPDDGSVPPHVQIIDEFLANHFVAIRQEFRPQLQTRVKATAEQGSGFLGWRFPTISLPAIFTSHTTSKNSVRGRALTL